MAASKHAGTRGATSATRNFLSYAFLVNSQKTTKVKSGKRKRMNRDSFWLDEATLFWHLSSVISAGLSRCRVEDLMNVGRGMF